MRWYSEHRFSCRVCARPHAVLKRARASSSAFVCALVRATLLLLLHLADEMISESVLRQLLVSAGRRLCSETLRDIGVLREEVPLLRLRPKRHLCRVPVGGFHARTERRHRRSLGG